MRFLQEIAIDAFVIAVRLLPPGMITLRDALRRRLHAS